jgi:hypothetical protein
LERSTLWFSPGSPVSTINKTDRQLKYCWK